MEQVIIDGVRYPLAQLSEEAKAQLASLQFVDRQIRELQAQLAVYQTARRAYAEALKQQLPEPVPETSEEKSAE